eukprot:g676.t1
MRAQQTQTNAPPASPEHTVLNRAQRTQRNAFRALPERSRQRKDSINVVCAQQEGLQTQRKQRVPPASPERMALKRVQRTHRNAFRALPERSRQRKVSLSALPAPPERLQTQGRRHAPRVPLECMALNRVQRTHSNAFYALQDYGLLLQQLLARTAPLGVTLAIRALRQTCTIASPSVQSAKPENGPSQPRLAAPTAPRGATSPTRARRQTCTIALINV